MNTERHLRILFALVVIVGAASFALIGWGVNNESANRTEAIRESQVESCERNNVLRGVIRDQLREENRTARRTPPELFPDIPPAEFKRLIQERIETRNEAIRDLGHIDCEEVTRSP